MKKILSALLILTAFTLRGQGKAYPADFFEINVGIPLESENVGSGHSWEMRAGQSHLFNNGIYSSQSFGFTNYEGDAVPAVSRLLPGDLTLRSFNAETIVNVHLLTHLSFRIGGGAGWTWISHAPGNFVDLANLDPYGPDDKLISVSERVRDNLSATFKTGFDYRPSPGVVLGVTAKYFALHTSRHRDVVLYDEASKAAYYDRYYTFSSDSPVEFDSWTINLMLKFLY